MFTAGQILQERYQLKRQMSDRAGRQTWLALDRRAPKARQRVVIKLLAFGGQNQWQDLKLFEREVTVLQQLQHPRIPRCQAAFHVKKPQYWVGFVAQYIPGASLQWHLDQGRTFTELEVKAIATQVLKILQYLHGCQPPVFHRDLKPSNLILTPQNQIFLVDFGAVQDRPRPAGQSFTVVGSYGYTPMEQFGGQTVPASDLYALGATLVHLLTGITPAELVQPDLTLVFCDRIPLTPSFTTWLTRMTAPALAQRFPTATAALQTLQGPPALPNPETLEPQSSRIQVQVTPQRTFIQVPSVVNLKTVPWLEVSLMASLLLVLVLIISPVGGGLIWWGARAGDFTRVSAGILLLLLGLGVAGWASILLKRNLSATQLECLPEHLNVKWQWLGITYWQRRWSRATLTQVTMVPLSPMDAKVMIHWHQAEQVNSSTVVTQVTPSEGQWVTDEIQTWLQ